MTPSLHYRKDGSAFFAYSKRVDKRIVAAGSLLKEAVWGRVGSRNKHRSTGEPTTFEEEPK